MAAPERATREEPPLVALLSQVNRARAAVRAGWMLPTSAAGTADQGRRCGQLVGALEAYATAASRCGAPLPYRLRDEIRMYRAMYPDPPRRQAP